MPSSPSKRGRKKEPPTSGKRPMAVSALRSKRVPLLAVRRPREACARSRCTLRTLSYRAWRRAYSRWPPVARHGRTSRLRHPLCTAAGHRSTRSLAVSAGRASRPPRAGCARGHRTGDTVEERNVGLVVRADHVVQLVLLGEELACQRRSLAAGLCDGCSVRTARSRTSGSSAAVGQIGGPPSPGLHASVPRTSPPAQNALPPAPLIKTAAHVLAGSSQALRSRHSHRRGSCGRNAAEPHPLSAPCESAAKECAGARLRART